MYLKNIIIEKTVDASNFLKTCRELSINQLIDMNGKLTDKNKLIQMKAVLNQLIFSLFCLNY